MTAIMKKAQFRRSLTPPGDCIICYEPYSHTGEHDAIRLACGHWIGRRCLEEHLSGTISSDKCPMCRAVLFEDDLQEQDTLPEGTNEAIDVDILWRDVIEHQGLAEDPGSHVAVKTFQVCWTVAREFSLSLPWLGLEAQGPTGIRDDGWSIILDQLAKRLPYGAGSNFEPLNRLKRQMRSGSRWYYWSAMRVFFNRLLACPSKFIIEEMPYRLALLWLKIERMLWQAEHAVEETTALHYLIVMESMVIAGNLAKGKKSSGDFMWYSQNEYLRYDALKHCDLFGRDHRPKFYAVHCEIERRLLASSSLHVPLFKGCECEIEDVMRIWDVPSAKQLPEDIGAMPLVTAWPYP